MNSFNLGLKNSKLEMHTEEQSNLQQNPIRFT